ncbi:MAG TPA: DUF1559 domain-containing protein [Pirellulales bacterium]|nr:DUF1559 domain-containing protein [Pirellulales bacterium]
MPPDQILDERRPTSSPSVLSWLLATIGVLLILVMVAGGLLWQAINAAIRARLQREECAGRLKKIGTALQNYHDEHGAWPPAVVADSSGRPLHTWRVLILPHLGTEEEALYKQYHFDEPWNGPRNSELAEQMPEVYGCPLDPNADLSQTSFLALLDPVTGDFAVHPPDPNAIPAPPPPKPPFMVVEVAESSVNWLEPKDLVFGGKPAAWPAASPPAELSYHVGKSHVLVDDLTTEDIPADEVRAALGGDGR